MDLGIITKNCSKILLLTLPFLTPIIPPVGISCIKSYLCQNGISRIKTVDAMANIELKLYCYKYFDTLKGYIPNEKRGFFFNIGLDVLSNHFTAHVNYKDELKYKELVKLLVYNNFYTYLNDNKIDVLIKIVEEFYLELENYIIEILEAEKPGVLGLSIYKGTLGASLFVGRLVKRKYPHIKIIVGGASFSQELFPDTPNFKLFCDKADYFDHIFIGEGEILLYNFFQGKLPNKKIYNLDDIKNEILNLNETISADFSDFDLSEYLLLPTYTSRGCIYKCSFCAENLYWKKYHNKDIIKVVNEFEEMSDRYGKKVFLLTDCLINPVATPLAEELIKRNKLLYWDVYLKVDKQVCDLETVKLWRKGGFYRARIGVESGSQKILNFINKKISIDDIKNALRNLSSAGIKTTTYWIAGYPGETEEDFIASLDLLEELQDYIYEAECEPFKYFYSGQVSSNEWSKFGNRLLYPEEMTEMLITQTWELNMEPTREVKYERVYRFKEHCKKLNIPNPYSISEICKADERWCNLHKNAVPQLIELI